MEGRAAELSHDGYSIIDCDTHITEPPDVWTSRVLARYVDHVRPTAPLLTHQSGLPGFGRSVGFTELHDWDHMVGLVEDAALWFEPRTASCYALIICGFILGELVHRLSGQPFDRFFASEIEYREPAFRYVVQP